MTKFIWAAAEIRVAPVQGGSCLQNRGHALTAGRTDGNQCPDCPAAVRLLLGELLGRLGENPPTGRRERVARGQ